MKSAEEIAVQVWCAPECSGIEIDSRLVKQFAETIKQDREDLKLRLSNFCIDYGRDGCNSPEICDCHGETGLAKVIKEFPL